MNRSSMLVLAGLVVTGCVSGSSGCSVDPCADSAPPRFFVQELGAEPVDGRIRFPSPGSIEVSVNGSTDEKEDAGSIAVTGDLESTVEVGKLVYAWTAHSTVEVRAEHDGLGVIEATDGCGRTSRLEVEAVPVASIRAEAEADAWIAALPEELTRGGVALLPGLPFAVDFELLDADGRPLAGTWKNTPAVGILGGLSVEKVSDRRMNVVVASPAGPATLIIHGAGFLHYEVGTAEDGERLEVWRNANPVDDWVAGWAQGAPIGEELVVPVGEQVVLGMHAFDTEGRLLIGIDDTREPHELEPGADAFVESSRGWFLGDSLLRGLAPGETTVVAQKAGATASFRLRVVEESLP